MKRMLILLTLLMLTLSGCDASGQMLKEPVTFYYMESEFSYGPGAQAFAAEEREASGHREDLSFLLALYLIGPTEDAHVSPIPRGTRILEVAQTEDEVTLTLSETAAMTDAAFTRASACLTLTCLELTDAEAVTIRSGSRSVTMRRDTLILFDDSLNVTEETQ